ncbi:uncharacterized protein NPIL_693331 [Nephila pilipes]|uniref:Uncharacterized protein n=1 Tax=Nephila pilipes TaxID=299642 RepID=A0A8X6R0S5_NEPPI|nr:uncharacterized protein NPIL_693331 [Nephila pilipes]
MKKNSNPENDISLTMTQNDFFENIINISNSYVKLIRVISFLYRFIHNCKTRSAKIKGPLTSKEVSYAENWLIRSLHEKEFPEEMRKLLAGANETQVLGLSWNTHEDYLTTDTKSLLEFVSLDKNMKHFILKAVGKFFDPLGLISPFTGRMKCLLQDLWREEIQWDDPLPTHIEKEWKNDVRNFPT